MGEYFIRGRRPLRGTTRIYGAKNAVLPMFAGMLLNRTESVLHNCPRISDTFASLEILRQLGCTAYIDGHTVVVNSKDACRTAISQDLSRVMRSSVLFMGALLARFGEALLYVPGGCDFGARPIDLHLKYLRRMGADIDDETAWLQCRAPSLTGKRIWMDFPSVGATENLMLAAIASDQDTTLCNAAQEPEIADLQHFLNAMGADIRGAGTGTIVIRGGTMPRLTSVEYRVMPDRIVAGTFLAAAAATGGDIQLTHVDCEDLIPITAKLTEMGCQITEKAATIALRAPPRLKSLDRLTTGVHPGFPTDLQAPFVAALTIAEGTSRIEERIYENRNKHIDQLMKMGAAITATRDDMSFAARGVDRLRGKVVEASDLRCGAALILAGLAAEGTTVVENSQFVERGYEKIEESLRELGGEIFFQGTPACPSESN